jgi:hypothetical protein
MAKAKEKAKKSDGKGKKGSAAKLPKVVRKSGFMDLINSDLGREILADAITAAAGAAVAALSKKRTDKKAGTAAADTGLVTEALSHTAAGAVAGVVTEAARQFLPASLVGDQNEAAGNGASEAKKVKYLNRASDHSKRKTTKAKSEKAPTAEKQ